MYLPERSLTVEAAIKKGASLTPGFTLLIDSTIAVVSSAGCNKDIPKPPFVGVTQGS